MGVFIGPMSSHINTKNFFGTAPAEILLKISKYYPARTLNCSKICCEISKECFEHYNKDIIKLCPSLQGIYEVKKGVTDSAQTFDNTHEQLTRSSKSVRL